MFVTSDHGAKISGVISFVNTSKKEKEIPSATVQMGSII